MSEMDQQPTMEVVLMSRFRFVMWTRGEFVFTEMAGRVAADGNGALLALAACEAVAVSAGIVAAAVDAVVAVRGWVGRLLGLVSGSTGGRRGWLVFLGWFVRLVALAVTRDRC